MSEKTGSPQLFPWLKFTCASPEVFGEYSDLLKAEAERDDWKQKWEMGLKIEVVAGEQIEKLEAENAKLKADVKSYKAVYDSLNRTIDRLRELVNAVKDPTEDGGYFKSIYCEDIEGVNWFDARDALKGSDQET